MNEQAIQDAYELFKGQGYADSIDDFRILIANNSEALNDAYILFSSQGYDDSIEDFSNLMGTSAIKKKVSGQPMGFDSEVGSLESADTEQDYFTGSFGDALRGLDSVVPIGIGDFVDDMARAVAGGVNQGISSENASDLLLRGSMSTDEDIASYIESQKTAQKLGPSQEMMDYEKIYNEEGKGFWGVVKGLMLNPTVLPEVLVSSMSALASNSDALLAGAATIGTGATYGAGVGALAGGVGAVPGAIAGAAASIPYAFGVASSTLEMGATFGELLQEELGGKEATKENVRAILNDPNKLESIRNKAVARGIVIGTIDAFTGKLASGVGAKILTKSAAKSATNVAAKSAIVKSTAAGSAIEAVGGSLGEVGGRLAAGQEMDTSEILLEGLAELPGGVRSTVTAQLQRPQYKVNGKVESAETIDNLIATMTPAQLAVSNIEIKNDKARQAEMQKKVVKGKALQDVKEANPELNDATADAIADIELQIDALSSNLTQSGRAKRTALKEQIQNLQENQIQEEAAVDVADEVITAEAKDDSSPVAEFNAKEEFDLLSDEDKSSYIESANGDEIAAISLYEKDVLDLEKSLADEARFSLVEDGESLIKADEADVEAIAEEMNNMSPGEVQFVSPKGEQISVNPIEDSSSLEEFTEDDAKELGFENKASMTRSIESFDGIPMVTGISDIAVGGTVPDATGAPMQGKGGIMFNALAKVKAAWAGVEKKKSQDQYEKALDLYKKNTDLFDRLWKEGRIPDGHVPMAIVRMADNAIDSNEIVFRYLAPEVKAQSKQNQTAALNDIALGLKNKKGESNKALLTFIKKNNITTLGALLDNVMLDANKRAKGDMKNTLTLQERSALFSELSTAPGVKTPNKTYLKSLYSGSKKDNSTLFTADNIYKAVGEPSMLKAQKGDVVSIVGIDVKDGGVIDIDHPNYGTGPKGRLIALINNPVNGSNVFPTWRAKSNRVFKENTAGKSPSQKEVSSQTMGTAANDLAFQGDAVTVNMSDLDILIGKLKFAFPGVTVVKTPEEFNNILSQPGVRTKISEGKIILGLTTDGKIYLNPESKSLATPIHEYGHIWIDYLRSKQSGDRGTSLLAKGLKLVEGTQALKDAIEKYGDNKLAREEALVELMATKGSTIIEASKKSRFNEWMNAVFKYIKEKFTTSEDTFRVNEIKAIKKDFKDGIINNTERDRRIKIIEDSVSKGIKNMSLEEFINIGLADLFKGQVLNAKFDAQKESKGVMPRYELGDDVANFIKQARGQGLSEAAIRTVLKRRGLDADVIASSFEKTKGDAATRIKVSEDFATGFDRVMKEIDGIIEKSKKRSTAYSKIPQNIISYLEGTKLYQDATDVQREQMTRDIKKKFGIKQKSAPSIKNILGTIKNIVNITTTEKELLINRLKTLNEGAKNATSAISTASKLLTEEIKELEKKGKITTRQMLAVLSKFSNVKLLNESSIEKFVDYMTKVFNDVEYDSKMSRATSLVKKAKTNIKTKLGKLTAISADLDRLFTIKPSMIPASVLDTYMQIVESFGGSAAVLDVQEVSSVATALEEILNAMDQEYSLVEELANRFDASSNVIVEDGKINFAKSIANMLKEKEITEEDAELMRKYKTDIITSEEKVAKTEEEIQEEKDELIDQINKADVMKISALPSTDERDLAKRFEKLIGTNAISGMSVRDLKNILKLIDNVNNGYLPHLVQIMVEKMNADTNSKVVKNSIDNSRILTVTGIYSKLKSKITKKGWVTEMIRRNPLFYIDQLFGDYQSKGIFNSVFGGSAIGVAKFDADIKRVFGVLNKAQTRVAESFNNDGNRTLASKFLQQIYLSQLEYETNIGNPEVNQASKFVKATIKAIDSNKTSFTELESDLLEKMLGDKRLIDADGEFNSQKIYDTFNEAERESIAAIQNVYKSFEEKASFTAAVIRGKRIIPRNNYVHLNVLAQDGPQDLMTSPSEIQTYSNGMNPSTRGKSLTERTGTVSPLNFDVYASASRGAKFVLMDYHLTEPIRTARRTINATKKLLQGDKVRIDKNEREIINAIEEGFEEATMNLLTNSYMQTAWLDDALDYVKKNGYRAILASAPRFVAELSSNTAFALISDSTSFTAGTDLGLGFLSSEKAPSVMYNLESTETTRLYNDEGLTGRLVDTNSLNKSDIKTRKSKSDTTNTALQIWDNSLGKVQGAVDTLADALISTPDKLVMRPMWFGSFSTAFERITGNKPDFDKISANDEAYMTENKEALSQAKTQADERSVMTGSTNNAFMGLLKGTSKPNQSLQLKAFNSFNNFMSTFLIFEYVTARTGVMNAMGRGSLTQQQGAAIVAASATRMVMYTFLSQMLSEMVAEMFGFGEDEEDKKSADKRFGQAIASAATSLILGRDFGNSTKAIINFGVEQGNKEFLGFLRENDPVTGEPKYDVYKDGIQYQAIPSDKDGRGTNFEDWLKSLSAAYSPAIKSLTFILKKATEKEKKGEAEKQLQSDEKSIRIPLEVLGNLGFVPMYKDVRKLVLKSLYEEMAKEKKKSETEAAIEKQKLGPYETKTDMKRYDPDMYYNTFGPGAPDYDEMEAKRILAAEERKLRQYEKDQTFDYNPITGSYNSKFGRKKRVGGFGSNDGFGSSSFGAGRKSKRRGKSKGDGFNTN